MSALLDYQLFSGVVYGSAVHLAMSRIIVPHSAAPKREFPTRAFLTQLMPIALIVSHLSR